MSRIKTDKYGAGEKWYVKVNGELVAGFVSEKYADLFIEAVDPNIKAAHCDIDLTQPLKIKVDS